MEDVTNFYSVYSKKSRVLYTIAAIVAAVIIAGFWNPRLVDGFGEHVVAANTIGDTSVLASEYGSRGSGFGFIFAAIAGLATTFTACNCVVFAMIPGLACTAERSADIRGAALKAFGSFTTGVLVITGLYGIFVGFLGSDGVEVLNQVRLGQAQTVFTLLGASMLIWGGVELGYLDSVKKRFTQTTRDFFNQTTTKAFLLGLMVGLFAVGRPFPVFREFLIYAASAHNPLYGAGVMMIQGLGQIAVMALLFFLIVWLGGSRLSQMSTEKPYKFRLISGLALIIGGTYFIYYWGLAFLFDIGRWGFKLGWY